jgi:hypothetical protein
MDGNRGATRIVATELPDPAPTALASGAVRMRAPGCLRHLTWIYELPSEGLLELLPAALQRVHCGRLVQASERWGTVHVVRLILQFEVEFRLGERPRTLSLHHRVSCSLARRCEHHAQLERLLETLSDSTPQS